MSYALLIFGFHVSFFRLQLFNNRILRLFTSILKIVEFTEIGELHHTPSPRHIQNEILGFVCCNLFCLFFLVTFFQFIYFVGISHIYRFIYQSVNKRHAFILVFVLVFSGIHLSLSFYMCVCMCLYVKMDWIGQRMVCIDYKIAFNRFKVAASRSSWWSKLDLPTDLMPQNQMNEWGSGDGSGSGGWWCWWWWWLQRERWLAFRVSTEMNFYALRNTLAQYKKQIYSRICQDKLKETKKNSTKKTNTHTNLLEFVSVILLILLMLLLLFFSLLLLMLLPLRVEISPTNFQTFYCGKRKFGVCRFLSVSVEFCD